MKQHLLLFWLDLTPGYRHKTQGIANTTHTSMDQLVPQYDKQLPSQINRSFSARILPKENKNYIKNSSSLTWAMQSVWNLLSEGTLFSCFNTHLLLFSRYSWHYPPCGMKYYRYFTYFSDIQVGLLEDEKWKITSRRPSCPTKYSR